jgi:hypothetical protein
MPLLTDLAMAVSATLLGEPYQDHTKLNVVRLYDTALH